MTDQELIELIQTELPGDLTEEQLDRLRASMHESEEVREALLDELRMETTIAAHHVPRKKDEQQYVKKIQQMAAARKRWKYGWLVALMLWVTLIGSVIFVLSNIDFTKQPVDDPQLVLKKSGDPKAVDPVTDPDGKSDKTGGSVAGAGGDAKNPEKVGPDKVDPTPKEIKPVLMEFDPPWRLFDDSAARGDHAWRSKLSKLVRPRRNGPIKEHRGYDFLDVRGIFDVMPPDDKGRAIRLRFAHSNKWRLAFFSGNEGVGIERIHDGRLAAYSVKRPPNESTPHGLPADIPERFLRQQKFERIDSEINFNWGSGSPASGVSADDFAVRWTGKLLVPHDGSYRFVATSDDGVIVRINGERIIDDWIERWQTGSQSPVTLKKGAHDIEVLYFEAGGEAAMKLEWQTPGSPGKRIIPASALRTGTSHGLKGQYFYGSPLSQDQPITPPRVDDDNFRWRYLREGAIDLRYQDGHIVVARGDIVLLKAPMSRVPDSLTMEMAGRLYLAEALRLKPLNLKDNGFVADSTDESKPAKREWRLGPANEVAAAHRDYDYQVDRIKKREKGIAFQINHQARRIADEQKKWEAGNPALDKLPENIAAILKLAADKRSEEQANALSAYYASITPIFKNERAEIERWRKELVEKVPRDIGKIEKQDDGSIVFDGHDISKI